MKNFFSASLRWPQFVLLRSSLLAVVRIASLALSLFCWPLYIKGKKRLDAGNRIQPLNSHKKRDIKSICLD